METEETLSLFSIKDMHDVLRKAKEGTLDESIYTLSGTRMCDICPLKTSMNSCKAYPDGIPEDVYNGPKWNNSCLDD